MDKEYVEGELLVTFKEKVSLKKAKKIISSYGLSTKSHYDERFVGNYNYNTDNIGFTLVVKVPEGEEQKWIEKLTKNKKIVLARLNRIITFGITIKPQSE